MKKMEEKKKERGGFFACDHLFYDGMSGRNFHDGLFSTIQHEIAGIFPISQEIKRMSPGEWLDKKKL
jgi:hypothetical protein